MIVHNENLPRFFLVHQYMDDDGNLNNITAVAAGHMVSCYVRGFNNKSPMIYAWAKSDSAPIDEWVWTDEPAFTHSPVQYDGIKAATLERLKSLGYEPVVYTSPDNIDFEYPVYAKIQDGSSLDNPMQYLEYLPDDVHNLGRNDHPKVMTVPGVYDLMASEGGNICEHRQEYIFGLNHLHAILHNHAENPLTKDAILIITRNDTTGRTRYAILEAAIEMGYTVDKLRILTDLLASGHVVFDNELRSYSLKQVLIPHVGYRIPSEQMILTANEFYELYGYGLEPKLHIGHAEILYRSCRYALDWANQFEHGQIESIPTDYLVKAPIR